MASKWKLRVGTAAALLLLLGVAAVRVAQLPDQYPMDRGEFLRQARQLPKGLTEAEVDVWLKGYTSKSSSPGRVRYRMEENPDAIAWMPALNYAVIVMFDAEGKSVSAESAD